MSTVILPSDLCGTICAPMSKSYAQRLLLCAALSTEPVRIICNNICDDVAAMISCLKALGAEITISSDIISIKPIDRECRDTAYLDCRDSGATLRFILPVVCALGRKAEIKLSSSLIARPINELIYELNAHGAKICRRDCLIRVDGRLFGNEFSLPADISSQYVSGMLFALAVIGGGKVNITSEINSRKYIEMTAECLERSGVSVKWTDNAITVSGSIKLRGEWLCEGDWSGAAFFLCAGALGSNTVSVSGLSLDSVQGDKQILDILINMGAKVLCERSIISVSKAALHVCDVDARDIPDLVPVIAVLASACEGESRISGIERLKFKESDRIASVCDMINSLGGKAEFDGDCIVISGKKRLSGGRVSSCGDHRIVMSAAVASAVCDAPIILDSFEAYRKSYVNFKSDFEYSGGKFGE